MKSVDKSGIRFIRGISALMLLIVGVTGMFGGAAMVIDPSGKSLDLTTNLISNIFIDYRAPGIILFLVIGVLSLSVALLTVVNFKYYPYLVFYQGVLLSAWILVQLYVITESSSLQFLFGAIGVSLMLCGSYLLIKKEHLKVFY